MLGSPMKMEMAPELHPYVWRGYGKSVKLLDRFITTLISSMNYDLTSVPGLADVRVPHGDGDGPPELHPDVWESG